jgi:hypothetical protein
VATLLIVELIVGGKEDDVDCVDAAARLEVEREGAGGLENASNDVLRSKGELLGLPPTTRSASSSAP